MVVHGAVHEPAHGLAQVLYTPAYLQYAQNKSANYADIRQIQIGLSEWNTLISCRSFRHHFVFGAIS